MLLALHYTVLHMVVSAVHAVHSHCSSRCMAALLRTSQVEVGQAVHPIHCRGQSGPSVQRAVRVLPQHQHHLHYQGRGLMLYSHRRYLHLYQAYMHIKDTPMHIVLAMVGVASAGALAAVVAVVVVVVWLWPRCVSATVTCKQALTCCSGQRCALSRRR